MLSGAPYNPNIIISAVLIIPMRGWRRNSQPIAVAKPGTSNPIVILAKTERLCGKIGALDDPCQRHADAHRDRERETGEHESIDERAPDEYIAERLDIICRV